jgi:hypothetical protein
MKPMDICIVEISDTERDDGEEKGSHDIAPQDGIVPRPAA